MVVFPVYMCMFKCSIYFWHNKLVSQQVAPFLPFYFLSAGKCVSVVRPSLSWWPHEALWSIEAFIEKMVHYSNLFNTVIFSDIWWPKIWWTPELQINCFYLGIGRASTLPGFMSVIMSHTGLLSHKITTKTQHKSHQWFNSLKATKSSTEAVAWQLKLWSRHWSCDSFRQTKPRHSVSEAVCWFIYFWHMSFSFKRAITSSLHSYSLPFPRYVNLFFCFVARHRHSTFSLVLT